MKSTESGSGVKAAKVVEEMLSIINSKGLFTEKCKLLLSVKTDGRRGKDEACRIRSEYITKFNAYKSRHILGRAPRGIEQYGYVLRRNYEGIVISITPNNTWEDRFSEYLKKLYLSGGIDYTLIPVLSSHVFSGKQSEASQIRALHLANIEALKPESGRRIAERDERQRKSKATSFNSQLTEYVQANFPYRMATGKWAGGKTSINVYTCIGYESEGKGSSQKVWSDNGKWSGMNASYSFFINSIESCIVIGGLVTCYPKSYENRPVKPCVWWEQGRGFELTKKTGFLVGGYHSEAKTAEAAIASAKAIQRYYLKRDEQILTPDFVHRKFGFCLAGIRNFMAQNEITAERITVAELRNIVVARRELNCKHYRNHLAKIGIMLNCK